MKSYDRSRLSDQSLAQSLAANTSRANDATADQLADIGEFESRRLHRPAGHRSMFKYCVRVLHLSEQAAYKRILVARHARRFPFIFHAIADGRLHLTAVVLLSPHLTENTAQELLSAAVHKTKPQINELLAARFPQPDLPTVLEPIGAQKLSPEIVFIEPPPTPELSPELVPAPAPIPGPSVATPFPRLEPIAPERFALQVTIGREAHDLLRRAQDLLNMPSSDVEEVLTLALRELVKKLEQRRFGATDRPRAGRPRSNPDGRHIPVEVRRVVWKRDRGQCTFVSDEGQRCEETKGLEFDHIDPYARDGEASVSNIRLLCRAHNQLEAERTYGAEFMRQKREARIGAAP